MVRVVRVVRLDAQNAGPTNSPVFVRSFFDGIINRAYNYTLVTSRSSFKANFAAPSSHHFCFAQH